MPFISAEQILHIATIFADEVLNTVCTLTQSKQIRVNSF